MTVGPTKGAAEREQTWKASPVAALTVRAVILILPLLGAFLVVRAIGDRLYRPSGHLGLGIWFLQATIIGTVIATLLDRGARRLLPLATLFNMSLVFPDQAPSRFSVALRAGSSRKLQGQIEADIEGGLDADEGEAAVQALALVNSLSEHDRFTRGHTERVRAYADLIAIEMGLPAEDRAKLMWGVLLHDIGKVTVPEEILNKKTQLTDAEWDRLAHHPTAGDQLIEPLKGWLGDWGLATGQHHERWDGRGYPAGLAGETISLAGRITAVADAYDVITSKRSYKKPMSVEAARKELVDCAGGQFDPAVVRAFLNVSLGKRWVTGPLAVLSDLPISQLTNAPAAVSAGTLLAVGATVTVAPPEPEPALAFTAPTTIVVEFEEPDPTLPVVTTLPVIEETLPAPESTLPPETTTSAVVDDTPAPTTATTAAATSTSTSTAVQQTTTTIQLTTTTAPTTTAAPLTTTTTVAPTTTTTTAPTTTTTAPTTTTTTVPPGAAYFLKNPNSGNSNAEFFKTLELGGPDDPTLPNFDLDRDSIAGLSLESTGSGFGETDLRRIQRYGFDASGNTLSGTAQLTLYVATDADLGGAPVTIRADIVSCNWLYQSCNNPKIAETSATVSTWVNNGFQPVTFNFGSVSESFGSGRRLVLRLITEDGQTLHVGFDASTHPSTLNLQIS